MSFRVWAALGAEALLFAVLLFGAAGTVRWPAAWAFLILFWGAAVVITWILAREDPELLAERMEPLIQTGQPLWDQVLMSSIAVVFFGWLAVMGIDAGRWHWSYIPWWLQVIGAAGVATGMWICQRAFHENHFLEHVVRIQADRGHTVVSTGPYAVVRHPMYAGALLLFAAIPLMLGSWVGFGGSLLLASGLALRTALEDRALQAGLDGYRAYTKRVRYRLIPFVW